MIDVEKVTLWAWLVFVALVGGLLGYIKKHGSTPATPIERTKDVLFGVAASMFVAYVTFQIGFYYLQNADVCVALAGVAAWMGTDALVALEGALLNFIQKRRM